MIKRLIPFVFAAVLGLVGVFMTQRYIAQQVTRQRQAFEAERKTLLAQVQELSQSSVEVLVAQKDIQEGEAVTAAHLDRRAVPQAYVQPYVMTRPVDVLGLVALVPIAQGEQMLRNKLGQADEVQAGRTLSGLTPKGKRAVTIGTDALTGVGGLIHPGDRVDVLWTFERPTGNTEEPTLVTVTLFQNVPVLAVGDQLVGSKPKEAGETRDHTLTLALDPQETSLLLYARREGVIQLSLRPQEDSETVADVKPTDMTIAVKSILGQRVGGQPSKRVVEVIRGLEQSVVPVGP